MSELRPLVQELPTEHNIGGASGARLFSFEAYGKGNKPDFPYNVVNEKIAGDLARMVGLPVPEGLLYQHLGEWMFFSRAVVTAVSGETPPPGTARDMQKSIDNWPGIFEEMLCFDLFVCNNDRNPRNFLCDPQKKLWLIDFGNALFYRPSDEGRIQPGIPRLRAVEADLGALFDKPYGVGVLERCRTWEAMERGFERIGRIPDYYIENTIQRLPEELLEIAERDFLIEFLARRKTQMESIVRDNAIQFPYLKIPA